MDLLMCPICTQRLQLDHKRWFCSNQHSYDVAKQGYVNLHVVQHKHSKNPGDTVSSVEARRAFLQGQYYQPLQQAVVEQIQALNVATVLDIGCGEGYYTSAIQDKVQHCIGVDIAKNAVQVAAKLNPKVTWVVGTGAVLPVLDQSIDLCCSLFSPIPEQEILRVLKPEGYLLLVTPAEQHLYALREALFEQVRPHLPQKFIDQLKNNFDLITAQVVDAELNLPQDQLKNLIAMTPYAYKAKADKREQLEQMDGFALNASFQIYVLQKKSKASLAEAELSRAEAEQLELNQAQADLVAATQAEADPVEANQSETEAPESQAEAHASQAQLQQVELSPVETEQAHVDAAVTRSIPE